MSRQNKVNPGMYTQRGRLAQDDAARELQLQRSVGAPRTWQHGVDDKLPSFKGSPPKPVAPKAKTKAKAKPKANAKAKAKAVSKPAAKATTARKAAPKRKARG